MRSRTAASEDLLSPRRAPISMSWDPLDLRGYSMALSGARGRRKLLLLLQLLALFPLTVRSQSGFTSVNCGGGPDGSFIDPGTGIIWQTDDGNFIATGKTAFPHISADLPDGLPQELQTLRFFPSHTKNCYVIPTQATFSYLIRVGFFYGNYDGKASSQIQFNLSLDSTAWETVTLTYDPAGVNAPLYFEAITSNATSTSISVCLIKSGVDTPFINSLEARLISSEFVYTGSFSELVNLHLVGRANFGEPTTTYRYPDDPWDRRWLPYLEEFPQLFQLETLSAPFGQAIINSGDSSRDQPPSIVMATAVQGDLISYSRQMPATELFCAYQYFAELVTLSVFDRRYINWTTNIMTNPPAVINLTSIPSFTTYEYGYGRAFTTGSLLTYTLTPNFQSTLGAILNADEMYAVQLVAAGTSSSDVLALSKIKNVLSLGQWVGDPCLPVSWDELNCSLPVALPPKVVSIDLSNHNLSGSLPAGFGNLTSLDTLLLNDNSLSGPLPSDFASLTKLRILNLGNNSFNGSFPIFLTNLKRLTSLDVSNNDFAGTFPDTLLRINFRYAGNPLLSCSGPTCPVVSSPPPLPARAPPPAPAPPLSPGGKKKSSLVVIIAAVVGGIAILAIIIIIAVGAYCCCTRRPARAGTRAVEASVFAVSATSSPRSLQAASSPRSLQAASSPRSLQAASSSRTLEILEVCMCKNGLCESFRKHILLELSSEPSSLSGSLLQDLTARNLDCLTRRGLLSSHL